MLATRYDFANSAGQQVAGVIAEEFKREPFAPGTANPDRVKLAQFGGQQRKCIVGNSLLKWDMGVRLRLALVKGYERFRTVLATNWGENQLPALRREP